MMESAPFVIKNIKFRFREPQQFIFIFGLPLMFLALFYFMFHGMALEGSRNMFDSFIWGLMGFIVAFAVQSASVAFSQEKGKGTLKRLQTTPIGSSNALFIGFIISEIIIVALQLGFLYILAFGLLGVYAVNVWSLIVTFGIYLLLSITCIGIGLMLAAVLSEKLASEIPMLIIMPLDSPVIYVNPLFWAYQVAFNVAFSGKNLVTQNITLFNYTTQVSTNTGIPIIVGLPIIVIFGLFFLITGLLLFKKRLE